MEFSAPGGELGIGGGELGSPGGRTNPRKPPAMGGPTDISIRLRGSFVYGPASRRLARWIPVGGDGGTFP